MKIQWLGHSCFLITSDKGVRIVTDPYDDSMEYELPFVEADVVTISHPHHDHNNVGVLRGKPKRIDASGRYDVSGIAIHGHPTYHDENEGAQRGSNIVFTMKVDGVVVSHLGDLGHVLTPAAVGAIGHVDVLLIPIGGMYTIDKRGATETIDRIHPKIAIPMHVKNDKCQFPIETVEPFLALNKGKVIVRHDGSEITLSADTLPTSFEIHVLQHAL